MGLGSRKNRPDVESRLPHDGQGNRAKVRQCRAGRAGADIERRNRVAPAIPDRHRDR